MISFVIPAHNEAELLGRTLAALSASARTVGEPWEAIVVNDASTDRTAEIGVANGARVITVNHRQIAATRNAGAREAAGEVLFFVDADTVVTTGAVRAAVLALRRGAVGGGCLVRFDGPVPLYATILDTSQPRRKSASFSRRFCVHRGLDPEVGAGLEPLECGVQ